MRLKKKRKQFIILFLVLSGLNIFVYYKREEFAYTPYRSYNELYSNAGINNKVSKWSEAFTFLEPQHIKEVNHILSAETNINKNDHTIDKVKKIAGLIYDKFHLQYGHPSPDLLTAHPLHQFKELSLHKEKKIWCGHFALIFASFCHSQNIASRLVELKNEGDVHEINECFIPESNQWVMVDIPNNVLTATDKDGVFLNTVTFRSELHSSRVISAFQSVDSGIILQKSLDKNFKPFQTYYKIDIPFIYYNSINLAEVYSFKEKVKRYVLPQSWYEIYSTKEKSNLPFYFKLACISSWLTLIIFMLITLFKNLYD